MSTRVLGKDASAAAPPMLWRQSSSPPAGPPSAQSPGAGPQSDSATLQRRIAELEREAQAESAAAYQKGLRDGDAKARAQNAAELQAALEQMAKAVRDMAAIRPRLRGEAEADVVQLSIAIARRILHREMSVDPAALQALVRVALAKLERQDISRVLVHPAQAPAIKAYLDAGSARPVEVVADASREPGSLIFETTRGQLDASVNAQLEEIERGLTDRVQHQS
jgi:flagellar assembly protein FliH